MSIAAALLDPLVSALTVAVWGLAAVSARAAQTDRPHGPAPAVDSGAAHRALAACLLGLLVVAVQVAATASLALGGGEGPAPSAWTAWSASVTGAALVALRAVGPLRHMAAGRPLTDERTYRAMHAAVGAAAVAGVLCLVVAAVGTGLVPGDNGGGPYLAPVLVVAAVVLAAHGVLRRGGVPA